MSTQKQLLSAARMLGISGLSNEAPENEIRDRIHATMNVGQEDRPSDQADRKDTPTEVATDRSGRTPRSHADRELSTRPSDAWVPASILPSPIKQDGYEFRWIRTSMLGQSDLANVSRKYREKWVPVKLADHPELQVVSDLDSRFPGNVEVGGLLLCKAPAEEVRRRREYYDQVASQQIASVDKNYMKESDSRMPMDPLERTPTRTSFGRG